MPILMIGMDAAEITLVEKLCSQGQLPALQTLREKGCFGPLEASATVFSGGVWPTFYTSQRIPWHGIYHYKQWHAGRMNVEIANEEWFPARPFWELLDSEIRMAVIDVPMVLAMPRPINGIQLAGWGTHDLIHQGSWPEALWKQLTARFGSPQMAKELYGSQSAKTLLAMKRQLLQATEQMADVCEYLLSRENWDLFFAVFGATHRGGHYLWDLSQIETQGLDANTRQTLEQGLVEIYQACDKAIARLLEKARSDTKVLVFAVHGMGRNPGWSDRCIDIFQKIHTRQQQSFARQGLIPRLKRVFPEPWKTKIKQSMSRQMRGFLTQLGATATDWSKIRSFPLPMDHAGYLRINLEGREQQGTVDSTREYEALCQQLQEAFSSFRDIETGQPIVQKIFYIDELSPPDAPYRDVLPDLVIQWADISAIQSRAIHSPQHGEITWQSEGKLPSGRAGNHRDNGWFVATGEGISPGTRVEGHHIIDLVPTLFDWLGVGQRENFQGHPIY